VEQCSDDILSIQSCLAGWCRKVLRCCSVVRASNTYCCHCRLESLTLKRFVITDSLGLDELTWLKLLHIVDSVAASLVSTYLHCLSAWRSYSILFSPYSVYCQLCKNTMNIRMQLTSTAFLTWLWMRNYLSVDVHSLYLCQWYIRRGSVSVLWRCWLGGRKGIGPVKTEWWGTSMVICLERGANDLRMVQLMSLPPHHLLLQ